MEKMKIMLGKINYDYDREVDVLYISFGKPQKAICVEDMEGILFRIDPFRDKVVGITVMDFKNKVAHISKKEVLKFAEKKLSEFLRSKTTQNIQDRIHIKTGRILRWELSKSGSRVIWKFERGTNAKA